MHQPFPAEVKNKSQVPRERFMTDVWGPARVTLIKGGNIIFPFVMTASGTLW